jgi:hypothetical protein
MVCAFLHPTWDKILQRIDNMQPAMRRFMRLIVVAGEHCT